MRAVPLVSAGVGLVLYTSSPLLAWAMNCGRSE